MLADFWDVSDWKWHEWVSVASGLLATALVLVIGSLLFRRRKVAYGAPPVVSRRGLSPDNDPFIHGSATERRQALRRVGNPVSVLVTNFEQTRPRFTGWVADRSTGGLCLSVPERVEPRTVLSVRTSNAPESVPWTQVEVRNCRQVEGGWELGCQFVRTPPWSVLLLFG